MSAAPARCTRRGTRWRPLALGIGVGRVSIRGGRSNDGVCEVSDAGPSAYQGMGRLAAEQALILSGLPLHGCGQDEREARAYALELAGEADADRVLEEWRRKTRALLFDWQLGDLSIALCGRESLTGSEVG
jgi:hypothetical protein